MAFQRRINVKPVIAVPQGSILPENLEIPIISEGTFIEKLVANAAEKIAVMVLSTEELIALVEKPHLFGVDVLALVGVPGGRYDAVWSTYIAPLKRVSLETLESELRKIVEGPEVTKDTLDVDTPSELVKRGMRRERGSHKDTDDVDRSTGLDE